MKKNSLPTFSAEPSNSFIGTLLGRRVVDHNTLFKEAPFGDEIEDIYTNLILRREGSEKKVALTIPYATAYLKAFNFIAEKVLELTARARENGLDQETANSLEFYMRALGAMTTDGE